MTWRARSISPNLLPHHRVRRGHAVLERAKEPRELVDGGAEVAERLLDGLCVIRLLSGGGEVGDDGHHPGRAHADRGAVQALREKHLGVRVNSVLGSGS